MGRWESRSDVTARRCFKELQANPGDRLWTKSLMEVLGQLPNNSPWLRLHKLVNIYQLGYAPGLDTYLDRYHRLDPLLTVLHFDNLYMYKDEGDQKEKIYSHQWLVGARILKKASAALSKQANLKKIEECRSFDELLQCVESATSHIHRFGTLAVYDTALRIGAKRGTLPERVYLHAGARKGYRNLMKTSTAGQEWIRMDDLPKEVQVLEPHHAENFLCIFKEFFSNSGNGRVGRLCY